MFVLLPDKEIREGHECAKVGGADGAFGSAFESGPEHLRIGLLRLSQRGGGFVAFELEAHEIPFAGFYLLRAEDDGGFLGECVWNEWLIGPFCEPPLL